MQDFMPTHVYYSIYDFPNVALEEYIGQLVEWSWKYNKSKLELFREYLGNWHQNPDTLLCVGTRILIFLCLDPKLVPKTGNLRFGNSKIRETG
jgi:hypothetical protein